LGSRLAELGQKLDSIEGGGDADALAVGMLEADDGSLAEGPTRGCGNAWGQHENEFELGSGLERRFGVEEDAGGAEIASDGRLLGSVFGAELDGNLKRSAWRLAAFGHWVSVLRLKGSYGRGIL
jgi:hypothetical protein